MLKLIERGYNKKIMKSKKAMSKLIATMMIMVLSVGLVGFAFAAECASQDCGGDLSITVGNDDPVIPQVAPLAAITLSGATTTSVTVAFNATDVNGGDDLDIATAQVELSKGGEATRTLSTCDNPVNITNGMYIECTGDMQFYDAAAADWVITATIDDQSSATATNDSTFATVNALDYIAQDISAIAWTSVSTNSDDEEADAPMVLTNGGNQDYTSVDITGYDATGGVYSDVIAAEDFSIDADTGQTTGQTYMVDSTPVDCDAQISGLNTHGADVTDNVYFYVDVPTAIQADTYTSDSSWSIAVSA
jgi:hypothetical protein